jgi:hypothetical protein
MATIVIEENEIQLKLSFWEKLGAFHDSPRAAKSAIRKIEFEDQLWGSRTLRGIRAPGTAIPYVVLLGTLRGRGYRDFVAMKGRGKGCIVTLSSGPFERWIFTLEQPESEFVGLVSVP